MAYSASSDDESYEIIGQPITAFNQQRITQPKRRFCGVCALGVVSVSDFLTCTVCRKWIHEECDSSFDAGSGADYTCVRCRPSPLVSTLPDNDLFNDTMFGLNSKADMMLMGDQETVSGGTLLFDTTAVVENEEVLTGGGGGAVSELKKEDNNGAIDNAWLMGDQETALTREQIEQFETEMGLSAGGGTVRAESDVKDDNNEGKTMEETNAEAEKKEGEKKPSQDFADQLKQEIRARQDDYNNLFNVGLIDLALAFMTALLVASKAGALFSITLALKGAVLAYYAERKKHHHYAREHALRDRKTERTVELSSVNGGRFGVLVIGSCIYYVTKGSPAELEEVRSGDEILTVDGEDMVGLSGWQIVDKLHIARETSGKVVLGLRQNEEMRSFVGAMLKHMIAVVLAFWAIVTIAH